MTKKQSSFIYFFPGSLSSLTLGITIARRSLGCCRRLALELLDLADRFGAADPRGISIALNLSHELLASLVGASRQQVTEYINEFDAGHIIFRDGRRIIIDPEKVQKILRVVA
ncbi:MAG: helix-turn-helix domain-containing protein [Candidatus Binatia bacterium]